MGIYMSYGSIKGDATQQGFEHWINVLKFDWPEAVKRDITTQTGRARNREHGQPKIGRIKIAKEVDHASGPLYKALVAVPKAETCKIAFVRTDEGGEKYLEYVLTDALLAGLNITGASLGGANVERASETWDIDFTEIAIAVKQLDVANVAGADYHFKYNMATGKGG
jgi:type VI secretion system secreted protein Hcp